MICVIYTYIFCMFYCPSCLFSGAGQVLAESVPSLRSVQKLSICDISPVPLLRVMSQIGEHCSVSTLGIALEEHPKLVRCVSIQQHLSSTSPVPLKAHYLL